MDRGKGNANNYVGHLNGACASIGSVYDNISSSSSGTAIEKSQLAVGWQSSIPDLKTLFECPVCFDYVLPPILQCQNGHLVCSECRQKISTCPTCRVPLNNNIRNLQMEKLASTMLFPCKYSSCGCETNLLCSDKSEHENGCQYKPYPCPCPGSACNWHGRLSEIMEHLKAQHQTITILQGEDIVFLATDINLSGAIDWVMLQYCFQHHFVLVLEKQEKYQGHQQFFAVVQLIGTPKQAEQFMYRLELKQPKRRLTWEAKPKSIEEGFQSAFNSSDCLVFDTHIAKLFAPDGNLGINVTISLVDRTTSCVRQSGTFI